MPQAMRLLAVRIPLLHAHVTLQHVDEWHAYPDTIEDGILWSIFSRVLVEIEDRRTDRIRTRRREMKLVLLLHDRSQDRTLGDEDVIPATVCLAEKQQWLSEGLDKTNRRIRRSRAKRQNNTLAGHGFLLNRQWPFTIVVNRHPATPDPTTRTLTKEEALMSNHTRHRRYRMGHRFGMERIATPLLIAFVSPLLLVGTAAGQSGGLYLTETGGPINGTAQAGSAAVARDAETAYLNPAGMTRLDSPEILFSVMPFYLDFEFNPNAATTIPGSSGGNQGRWFPGGSLFIAIPVHERVSLGLSVTVPAGLALDPDDTWVGRNWTTETTLLALNIEPSIGVRLTEQWSVGAGLDIQYVDFEQNLDGPLLGMPLRIDGDSWDVGGSVSVLWEPLETTRFGLRYRSEISHDLDGDLTVNTAVPISSSFTMPMSLTFSAYHEFNTQFALLADIGWTDWSAFDHNVITFTGAGVSTELPRNFKDTWNISLGGHIRPADNWLVMFGAGYTSSAVSDENRTPDLPVDQQVRASVGLEYKINEQWSVGGNYTFLWMGDNDLNQTVPIAGRIAGDYDAFAHIFGIYGSVSF